MVFGEGFAEEKNRENRAEGRHEMDEGAGNVGAKGTHRPVPENKGQDRGKNRNIDNRYHGAGADHHGFPGSDF